MLDDLGTEGVVFRTRNSPIVLHHWDLEPRNLIVSNAKTDDDNNNNNPHGAWKITGLIDWDDALALPLLLARPPPRWLW
ncbi:MAG: hypothetical protein Q9203_005931, partial [Teloschistes exilis]